MANIKRISSKNLSLQLEKLLQIGKVDLAVDLLKANELRNLLPNILRTLKKRESRKKEYQDTKIYSKTDLDANVMKKLEDLLKIDVKNSQIIIDESLGAGVKIQSGDRLIDATLETMLEKQVEKIVQNY